MKISQVDAEQIGISGVERDVLVIEKHTYARVISDRFEETDIPAEFKQVALPAEHGPLSPAAGSRR